MRDKQIERLIRVVENAEGEKTIVVNKNNSLSTICRYAERIVYAIIRICLWLLACIIMSCGASAILNEQIREIIVIQILGR